MQAPDEHSVLEFAAQSWKNQAWYIGIMLCIQATSFACQQLWWHFMAYEATGVWYWIEPASKAPTRYGDPQIGDFSGFIPYPLLRRSWLQMLVLNGLFASMIFSQLDRGADPKGRIIFDTISQAASWFGSLYFLICMASSFLWAFYQKDRQGDPPDFIPRQVMEPWQWAVFSSIFTASLFVALYLLQLIPSWKLRSSRVTREDLKRVDRWEAIVSFWSDQFSFCIMYVWISMFHSGVYLMARRVRGSMDVSSSSVIRSAFVLGLIVVHFILICGIAFQAQITHKKRLRQLGTMAMNTLKFKREQSSQNLEPGPSGSDEKERLLSEHGQAAHMQDPGFVSVNVGSRSPAASFNQSVATTLCPGGDPDGRSRCSTQRSKLSGFKLWHQEDDIEFMHVPPGLDPMETAKAAGFQVKSWRWWFRRVILQTLTWFNTFCLYYIYRVLFPFFNTAINIEADRGQNGWTMTVLLLATYCLAAAVTFLVWFPYIKHKYILKIDTFGKHFWSNYVMVHKQAWGFVLGKVFEGWFGEVFEFVDSDQYAPGFVGSPSPSELHTSTANRLFSCVVMTFIMAGLYKWFFQKCSKQGIFTEYHSIEERVEALEHLLDPEQQHLHQHQEDNLEH